jgi:phage gp45-like
MRTTSKTLSIFVVLAASTALTLDTSTVSAASSIHAHHHHIQLMNSFTNATSIVGINGIMSGSGGSSTTQHGSSNSHSHHHRGSANSIADINWYQLGN